MSRPRAPDARRPRGSHPPGGAAPRASTAEARLGRPPGGQHAEPLVVHDMAQPRVLRLPAPPEEAVPGFRAGAGSGDNDDVVRFPGLVIELGAASVQAERDQEGAPFEGLDPVPLWGPVGKDGPK